eukprot:TRINITY_DN459_c0_g1_i2.p1 TRINITY_DN459_c0_g1~~TRINITY_DN459_c0_g1_i2.p1  ORF type:complete len:404 (+),score=91.62 TRINITY_DN459_c0_g1_i2:161-1372(+)
MKIAQEAAQGMNWLHCMKPPLLHLDLKTANLLLTTEWHVKVADFGLSRVRGNDGDIKQVSSATVGGTPYYMAPELFLEKVTPDEKCDIYAYAIILWELVTEKNPYEGQFKNVHQLVQGILNENVRPIIPQSCPQMLKEVITKCWDKDSRKRPSFQSILDSKVFDEVALEAITTGNKACIRMWKGFNKDAMEDKEPLAVPWEEFLDGFCKMIKVKNTNKENIKFQCLRSVLDADKEPHGRVTQQAFQRFLQWFGPITEGVSILEQVKGLLEQKWFHGVMSAKEAENKIVPLKRGSYLVRFSSREEGGFTITFLDNDKKKKNVLHYRIPDQFKYNLEKFVKLFKKQKHLSDPAPHSPYEALFVSNKNLGGYLSTDDDTPSKHRNTKDSGDSSFAEVTDADVQFIF